MICCYRIRQAWFQHVSFPSRLLPGKDCKCNCESTERSWVSHGAWRPRRPQDLFCWAHQHDVQGAPHLWAPTTNTGSILQGPFWPHLRLPCSTICILCSWHICCVHRNLLFKSLQIATELRNQWFDSVEEEVVKLLREDRAVDLDLYPLKGIAALVAMNILEQEESLGKKVWGSAEHVHAGIEAMRLSFADALSFVADPEVLFLSWHNSCTHSIWSNRSINVIMCPLLCLPCLPWQCVRFESDFQAQSEPSSGSLSSYLHHCKNWPMKGC